MPSIITIVSIFTAAATLGAAAPAANQARWSDPTVCAPGTGYYQVCGKSGFKGCCTTDACSADWCPDYKPYTYERVTAWKRDPTVCAPGTGYYQVCASNGFKGCCKTDACSSSWCPDTPAPAPPVTPKNQPTPAPKPNTPAPVPAGNDPTVCAAGTGYYQVCAGNGFKGCCKTDACSAAWCPDYKFGTYQAHSAPAPAPVPAPPKTEPTPPHHHHAATPAESDPTVCAPGTGYYQVCAKSGFKGCCKSDACGADWCPDYKFGTYQAAGAPVPPKTETSPHHNHGAPAGGDPTVCAPGTGFYQVCSNGFKGCCKADACTIGYCPL